MIFRSESSKIVAQIIEDFELGHVKRLIIGYEDRLVRFGYGWFEAFCERHGTEIKVMNGEASPPRRTGQGSDRHYYGLLSTTAWTAFTQKRHSSGSTLTG